MDVLQHLREEGRAEEVAEKHRRVVAFLQAHGLDGVLLTRRDNFAWYTGGGDNHIPSSQEAGVATLWITPDGATLLTSNIEAARIMEEELAGVMDTCESWGWYEDADAFIRARIAGKRVVSDTGIAGTENRSDALKQLRYELTENERRHLGQLGRVFGEALEWAARSVRIGDTEHEIGARLSQRLLDAGVEPTVNLVAVDERIFHYRHPIPTGKRLERYAMLVGCARSGGLIVAATRLVHFGTVPRDVADRYTALLEVEATLHAETKAGQSAADVLNKAIAAYERVGFKDEWKDHHQGGAIGYDNREWLATPHETEKIRENQALAWNPSIRGTKVEDTTLLTSDGLKFVTSTDDWPSTYVSIANTQIARPEILVKHRYF